MRHHPHGETPLVIGSAADAIARGLSMTPTSHKYATCLRDMDFTPEANASRTTSQRARQVRRLLLIVIALPVAIAIGVPLLLFIASMVTQ